MRRDLLKTIAKGAVGFLLGLGVWAGFAYPYADVVSATAQPIFRIAEKPNVTRLFTKKADIVVDRSDFPRSSPRPQLPLKDLTFNVIILAALFASEPSPLSTRNVSRFAVAIVALFVTHVFAFFVKVQSIYALQLGKWSEVNYNAFERNLWSGGAHFYRLVGLYAIVFLLWWLLRAPQRTQGASQRGGEAPKRARKKKKQ